MATNQTDNDSIVLVGAAVAAIGAVIYAVVGGRSSARPIINIPENFGSGSTSQDETNFEVPGTPAAEDQPAPDPNAGWVEEDPSATTPDSELDFGGTLPESEQPTPPDQRDPGESETTTWFPDGSDSSGGSVSDGDPVFESGSTADTINSLGRSIPGVAPAQNWLGL